MTRKAFQEAVFERFEIGWAVGIEEALLDDIASGVVNNTILQKSELWGHGMAMKMRTWILAGKHENGHRKHIVRVPTSWWQHFKDDIFPKWLKKLAPVDYVFVHSADGEVIEFGDLYVCPHADIKWKDDCGPHITFMTENMGFNHEHE